MGFPMTRPWIPPMWRYRNHNLERSKILRTLHWDKPTNRWIRTRKFASVIEDPWEGGASEPDTPVYWGKIWCIRKSHYISHYTTPYYKKMRSSHHLYSTTPEYSIIQQSIGAPVHISAELVTHCECAFMWDDTYYSRFHWNCCPPVNWQFCYPSTLLATNYIPKNLCRSYQFPFGSPGTELTNAKTRRPKNRRQRKRESDFPMFTCTASTESPWLMMLCGVDLLVTASALPFNFLFYASNDNQSHGSDDKLKSK